MSTVYIIALFVVLIVYGPLIWALYKLSKAGSAS